MGELIYSKYSNERSRRFSIRTDIYEGENGRYVEKCAVYPEGKVHVQNINRYAQELNELYRVIPFTANQCTPGENKVQLEYVEGQTLEEYLDLLLKKGKIEEAEAELKTYLDQVRTICEKEDFYLTEEFEQVFGKVEFSQGMKCAPVTNIDMVCANLILEETPVVLDYEWTFEFPVPSSYVLYRIIHYYVETSAARKVLSVDKLYEECGITEELQSIFRQMEQNFQSYITGNHVPIRELFQDITPGIVSGYSGGKSTLQVYFSYGKGYQEKESRRYPMENGSVSCEITLPEKCSFVRIDPGEKACSVYLETLSFDGKKANLKNAVVTSGIVSGKWAYIAQDDPGIVDIPVPAGAKVFKVTLTAYPGSRELIQRMCELGHENKQLRNLIQDMRNTKVWKLYQAYRNRVERKKVHE